MLFLDNLLKFNVYSDLFIFFYLSLILSSIFLILSVLIAPKNSYYEKLTAYECGFEPFEDARNQFDVKFYVVAILFLVFDVEILFLFPWTVIFSFITSISFWVIFFFLFILTLGFVYEVVKGALDW